MLRGNAGRDIQACGRIKPVRPATAGVSLVDERLGSAGEADERVRLDVVELAGDHEQVERVAELAARPVRFVAFWVATLLPFTYPPLLAAGVVTTHRLTFVALVCLNAVAFVAGHGYKRPD